MPKCGRFQPQNQLGIMPTVSLMCYSRAAWSIEKLLITFSWHGLKMICANFGVNQTNCLGVRKVCFQRKSKWQTANSSKYGMIGIIALGITQGIYQDQFHGNRKN